MAPVRFTVQELNEMGYTPLVPIACGKDGSRKTGVFLGGHQCHKTKPKFTDYFVECDCAECNAHGYALRAGEFQRHAGEEVAKKWRNSIKAEPLDGKSSALGLWIEKACRDRYGEGLVGKRVQVYWPCEGHFFTGTIDSWNHSKALHVIKYDGNDEEHLHWAVEKTALLDEHPQLPGRHAAAAAPAAPAATATAGTQDAAFVLAGIAEGGQGANGIERQQQQQQQASVAGPQRRQAAGDRAAADEAAMMAGRHGEASGGAGAARGEDLEMQLQALESHLSPPQRLELQAARKQLERSVQQAAGLQSEINSLRQEKQQRARALAATKQQRRRP